MIAVKALFSVIAQPCCLISFQFPFPASGICGEAHLFHMAFGAIISSISMTSFITREASDAQHFSLGLEQSPSHSLWPVLEHTSEQASEVEPRSANVTINSNRGLEIKYRQNGPY